MSNFITTNIRIPEEDYFRLKEDAVKKRQSLAATIREKLITQKGKQSNAKLHQLWIRRARVAGRLGKKFKDFDIVKALREMRYEGKW